MESEGDYDVGEPKQQKSDNANTSRYNDYFKDTVLPNQFLQNFQTELQRLGIVWYDRNAISRHSIVIKWVEVRLGGHLLTVQVFDQHFFHTLRILNVDRTKKIKPSEMAGSFGKVNVVSWDNKHFASKFIEATLDCQFTENCLREYCILRVASALGVAPTISNDLPWDLVFYNNGIEFLMEWCAPIKQYFYSKERDSTDTRRLRDLPEFAQFERELKTQLRYCHEVGIMHKDIKPFNLLVSRGTQDGNVTKVSVKYADFGISNLVYEGKLLKTSTIVLGTQKYAGSEMKGKWDKVGTMATIDLRVNDMESLKTTLVEIGDTRAGKVSRKQYEKEAEEAFSDVKDYLNIDEDQDIDYKPLLLKRVMGNRLAFKQYIPLLKLSQAEELEYFKATQEQSSSPPNSSTIALMNEMGLRYQSLIWIKEFIFRMASKSPSWSAEKAFKFFHWCLLIPQHRHYCLQMIDLIQSLQERLPPNKLRPDSEIKPLRDCLMLASCSQPQELSEFLLSKYADNKAALQSMAKIFYMKRNAELCEMFLSKIDNDWLDDDCLLMRCFVLEKKGRKQQAIEFLNKQLGQTESGDINQYDRFCFLQLQILRLLAEQEPKQALARISQIESEIMRIKEMSVTELNPFQRKKLELWDLKHRQEMLRCKYVSHINCRSTKEAIESLEESQKFAREIYPHDRVKEAKSTQQRGFQLVDKCRQRDGIKLIESAIAVYKVHLGPKDLDLARAYHKLAHAYYMLDEYELGMSALRQAEDIFLDVDPQNRHLDIIRTLETHMFHSWLDRCSRIIQSGRSPEEKRKAIKKVQELSENCISRYRIPQNLELVQYYCLHQLMYYYIEEGSCKAISKEFDRYLRLRNRVSCYGQQYCRDTSSKIEPSQSVKRLMGNEKFSVEKFDRELLSVFSYTCQRRMIATIGRICSELSTKLVAKALISVVLRKPRSFQKALRSLEQNKDSLELIKQFLSQRKEFIKLYLVSGQMDARAKLSKFANGMPNGYKETPIKSRLQQLVNMKVLLVGAMGCRRIDVRDNNRPIAKQILLTFRNVN